MAELVALADAEPPEPMIEGHFDRGDRVLMYSFTNVGKSITQRTMAFSIATGNPFLGRFPTRCSMAGILDEESARSPLGQQLGAMARALGLPLDDPRLPVFAVRGGARLDTDEGLERIFRWIAEQRLEVLFGDALIRMHRLHENEADDMARVADGVSRLQERVRQSLGWPLTVVLAHHAPKPRELSSNAPETMARGSGDILAGVDVGIYLRRGRKGEIVVEPSKARWTAQQSPYLVRIEGSAEGTEPTLRVVYVGDVDEVSGQVDRAVELFLIALGEGPRARGELVERAKAASIPTRSADRAMGVLVETGKAMKSKDGRKAIYALTEGGLLG